MNVEELETAARRLLENLVIASGLERQEIDRRLGFTRGQVSRVLKGPTRLTLKNIILVLDAIEADAELFFVILLRKRKNPRARVPFEEVLETFSRFPIATAPDEPAPEPATAPMSPHELKNVLIQAMREHEAERQVREKPKRRTRRPSS